METIHHHTRNLRWDPLKLNPPQFRRKMLTVWRTRIPIEHGSLLALFVPNFIQPSASSSSLVSRKKSQRISTQRLAKVFKFEIFTLSRDCQEDWILKKSLAIWAALWLVVNWVLGVAFLDRIGDPVKGDIAFYFVVCITLADISVLLTPKFPRRLDHSLPSLYCTCIFTIL